MCPEGGKSTRFIEVSVKSGENPGHSVRAGVLGRQKVHVSTVFAGQNVGIKQVGDKVWLVSFMHFDLGYFDHEDGKLVALDNPFAAKVLPMSPV